MPGEKNQEKRQIKRSLMPALKHMNRNDPKN